MGADTESPCAPATPAVAVAVLAEAQGEAKVERGEKLRSEGKTAQ